jgi:HrpA-like RNA helicase
MDPTLSSRPAHTEPVLRCILSGYVQNAALLHPDGKYRTILMGDRKEVSIHPMSTLFSKRMDAILYHEMIFTTRLYARNVSKIHVDWLKEAAPHYLGRVQR